MEHFPQCFRSSHKKPRALKISFLSITKHINNSFANAASLIMIRYRKDKKYGSERIIKQHPVVV